MVSTRAGCCKMNWLTTTGRRLHQMHMILLPMLTITALVIQNSYLVANISFHQQDVKELQLQVENAVEMGTVLTGIQQERVELAYYVFSNGSRLNSNETGNGRFVTAMLGRKKLEESFRLTDQAIELVQIWPDFSIFGQMKVLASKLMFQIHLENLRDDVDNDDIITIKTKMNYYTNASAHIMKAMIKSIKNTNLSNIWKYNQFIELHKIKFKMLFQLSDWLHGSFIPRLMIAYKDLIRSVEYFGITMVEGLSFFGEGVLNSKTYINYVKYDALAWKTLNQTKDFVPIIRFRLENMTKHYESFSKVYKWRKRMTANVAQAVDLKEAEDYYQVMTRLSSELRLMQQILLELIQEYMKQELQSADTQGILSIALLLLILSISPIFIFLIKNASDTIQACAVALITKTKELKTEKRRCNKLLSEMIPSQLAKHYQDIKSVDAETFDMVTVYMCNVGNLKQLERDLSPLEFIEFLNSVFAMLDSVSKKYDTYKTDAIGDGYMIVSGAPGRNGNLHVQEIANMALEIMANSKYFILPNTSNEKLSIRAGFNSGSIIAGILGKNMLRYCMMGSTVSIASKLEASGEAGKIQISLISKELLQNRGPYVFESKGYQEISKNKLVIPTYWLLGRDDTKIAENENNFITQQTEELNEDVDNDIEELLREY